MFFIIINIFSFFCFFSIFADDKAYLYLDQLAIQAGTDKSSIQHNYTEVYAQYFDSLKDKPIKFLEIGIYFGNSVKLWENYFPNAELHFMDINPDQIQYHSTRSHYHFVDQTNDAGTHQLARSLGGDFDVIIDDGGHRMDQQIISFNCLFPYVKSGGLYIIEDLATSYWKEYGAPQGSVGNPIPGKGTCVSMLKKLIDDLNYTPGVIWYSNMNLVPFDLRKKLTYTQEYVESIHFHKGLCVIKKR